MQANKYNQAQRLRRHNRDILFQNNRAYNARMSQEAENQITQNHEPRDEQIQLGQQYKTIITTFSTYKYKLKDLPTLMTNLNQNMMANYKAIIGIQSLGGNLLNQQNQRDVMTNGTTEKIISILMNNQHPYLQVRSGKILLRLMQEISSITFPTYFNQNTIPKSNLSILLSHQMDSLNVLGLKLVTKLFSNRYPIHNDSQQVSFFSILANLAEKWRTNSSKLNTIFNVLELFQKNFWYQKYCFNQRLLSIFLRLIEIDRAKVEQRSALITRIIVWTQEDGNLRRICCALKPVQSKKPPQNLYKLIYTIFNFPLNQKFLYLTIWKSFICNLASTKGGLELLQNLQIQNKIIPSMHIYLERDIHFALLQIYQAVLATYIKNQKRQQIQSLLADDITLYHLQTLYQQCADKQRVKSLNSVLLTTISALPFCNRVYTIRSYQLISEFINNTLNYDHMTIKATFKRLKDILQHLRRLWDNGLAHSFDYNELEYLIVSNKDFHKIREGFSEMPLQGMQEIMMYYEVLGTWT